MAQSFCFIYTLGKIDKFQVPKELRQWTINRCTSSMMIHKITLSVEYNKGLKHLNTQLNETTNQNSTKVSKVVKENNEKKLL